MKIVNAKLYEDEIRYKMWEIWYDEKYQYFFEGSDRQDFGLSCNDSKYQLRAFAVLNDYNQLIGCIRYYVDPEMRIAQWFDAINFSDEKIAFGMAIKQVIEDCFLKFGMEVIEWNVICGNPIEKSYDRLCKKMGGQIIGIRHKRVKDLAGKIHDDKIYEILRKDFLNAIHNKK